MPGHDGAKIHRAHRRAFLGQVAGAATAAAGLSVGSAAVTPDAGLIATCRAFDAIERRVKAYHGDPCGDGAAPIDDDEERDRVIAPLLAQQKRLLVPILSGRATTFEGVVARAHTLVLWAPDLAEDGEDYAYLEHQMLAALLRDLLALAPPWLRPAAQHACPDSARQ
jgi:hypothetical protein